MGRGPDEVVGRVGVGGLRALHRSAERERVEDLGEAGSGGAWLELGQRQGGACTGLRRARETDQKLRAWPVPRLGREVGLARRWGGALAKLKGKGTDWIRVWGGA